jgi:hypothetical protein
MTGLDGLMACGIGVSRGNCGGDTDVQHIWPQFLIMYLIPQKGMIGLLQETWRRLSKRLRKNIIFQETKFN